MKDSSALLGELARIHLTIAAPPPVIDLGGPGVGVTGRYCTSSSGMSWDEQVGDHQDTERVLSEVID